VEVEAGQLDPRLHLAACQHVQPYLPDNVRPWGKTRIGLRCVQGPTSWNVYLPVTVKVFASGQVAVAAMPAGTVLTASDLRETEVDLAAGYTAALTRAEQLIGRTLGRALSAGDTLHVGDLKARQYFTTGALVDLVAVGTGFQVNGQGEAMTPGLEGQQVRIRTATGRIVSGVAVGEHRVEIQL
jgi:flagella basal body P-ring formation protein FlgA